MNRKTSNTLTMTALLLLAGLAGPALAGGPGTADAKAADPVREARRLIEQLRAELKPVDDEIANAPYLTALEHHQVSLDNLRAFVGEEYYISRSDLRADSQMLSRFGNQPHFSFFLDLVDGEAQGLALLLDFGRALGLSEQDLQAYEPRPGAQTYPSYAAWLGNYGSQADVAAAYLLNFPVFGANTGRMGVALRNVYGFSAADTAYFDYFGSLPPSFENDALNVIQDGLNSCASTADIRRSARLLQAYEKDFWDAVALNPQ
jgi:pyrroloquinoline quinone (PQQ) biosynthesis protein C